MEFRILGPLEVVDRGEPVPVGGPKPRALLAALLLTPGTVVSTDRLVTAVWGADPPRDAVGALRAYVSRLRAVLPERLRWRAPGYALDVADGELDAAEFHRLTGLARERAAVGRPPRGRRPPRHRARPVARRAARRVRRRRHRPRRPARAPGRPAPRRRRGAGGGAARAGPRPGGGRGARRAGRAPPGPGDPGRPADARPLRERAAGRRAGRLPGSAPPPRRGAGRRAVRRHPRAAPPGAGAGPDARARQPRPAHQPAAPRHRAGRAGAGDRRGRAMRCGRPRWSRSSASGASGRPGSPSRWRAASATGSPTARGSPSWPRSPTAAPWRTPSPPRCGCSSGTATTIEQTVVEYFATRSLLLVLDNCEHVLDAAARLAQRIVAQCPGVVVLATSREPLGVDGEQVWPVPPLPLPDAAALFVLRARATRPDFDPDERRGRRDLPTARRPAARHRAGRGAHPGDERRRDRRAARRRSPARPRRPHRAAPPPEPRGRDRLVLPAAGRAGAAAVRADVGVRGRRRPRRACTPSAASPARRRPTSLDHVAALVDKSMVVAVEQAGVTRYRMLETLRAYARERQAADDGTATRHAEYFVGLAEAAARGVQGVDERAWIEATLPNVGQPPGRVRARLRRARRRPRPAPGRGAARADPRPWHVRGRRMGPAVTRPRRPEPPAVRGRRRHRRPRRVGGRRLRPRGRARGPGRRTASSARAPGGRAIPPTSPPTSRSTGATSPPRRRTTRPRSTAPAATATGSGWCGRCTTSRSAAPCAGCPRRGCPRRRRRWRWPGRPATRPRCRWATTRWGWSSRSPTRTQALALLDEAARLAAEVQNFWWEGIALMEAAATQGRARRPRRGRGRARRRARPLGPRRRLDPAVAQPALRRAAARPARRRARGRACCTTPWWPRASRHPSRRRAAGLALPAPRPSRWPGRASPATGS